MNDDDEYELEDTDPAVLAAEERRKKELVESARQAIDIDAVYREADRDRGAEVVEQWIRNFRFQFQVKHLLFGTALLAIFLTVVRFAGFGFTVFLLFILSIVALYLFLKWEESKQQAEAERKREEMYAERRARLQAQGALPNSKVRAAPIETAPMITPPSVFDDPAPAPEPFRIQFSMQTLLIAVTGAALTLGLIRVLGGATPMATILGLVAVGGLVAYAMGFEPPQAVVLGWWSILVLYVLLSLAAAFWPAIA
jgi:hypothetical protein